MKPTKIVIIFLILIFSIGANSGLLAQSKADKQISRYLYELGLYLRWENDYNIELIKIGVLNGSADFLKELKQVTKNGYDNVVLIEIINFKSVAEIKETHMLFIPKEQNDKFVEVRKRIQGFNTALITQEYDVKKSIMINFIKKGSDFTFEMNADNLKEFNIGYAPQISQLGGITISAKTLFNESEKNLEQEKRKVRSQQSLIDKQQSQISEQKASIDKQQKELDAQKNKLLAQADEIAVQEKRLADQRAGLLKIEEDAKKTKLELEKNRIELEEKEAALQENERLKRENLKTLENQKSRIEEGQKRIDAMNYEIAAQSGTIIIYKNIVLIISGFLFVFLLMLFFILRGYRIKKRDNKLLAEQKVEIEGQAKELEVINKELEKLSIVASETSSAVVILDTQGRFEWVNAGFTKMYGFTLESLIKDVGENIYKASNRPDIDKLMDVCLKEKRPVIYESFITSVDGEDKWAQSTLTPIINANNEVTKLILIDSDISKIKEAEEKIINQSQKISIQAQELEKQNAELEKLSLVASKTDNSVIIANVDGEIEWVNDGFTRLLGLTFEEFSSEYGSNMFKASLNPRLREQLQGAIKDKRSIIYSSKSATKDGRYIWIQTTMTPIYNADGALRKYIAIDADITKIKLAEEEITRQKEKITDSIIYARKIQSAVLPPDDYLSKLLQDYFIMFRPKDIVSGDFYWATHKGNKILIAAADCTGHGVPGGFMSMLGMTFLNEITGRMEEKDLDAGAVLTQLRESVKNSLRQTGKEGEAKDGMDIALCIIDKETKVLDFAGANNPLLIIRDHVSEIEIINVKADEMPIGIYYQEKSKFTNHKVQLQKGDLCYIFSDGYPDQFGGKHGRKFMAKRFKNLLAVHSDKPMEQQKAVLEKAFDAWKGENRQIDDVLVVGLKI
ncbi:MAG: YfiR/HmsC family protein [Bacteroidales bacterium]|nr:YfiR/HmsC family protein [Bacteroidales bacterium]